MMKPTREEMLVLADEYDKYAAEIVPAEIAHGEITHFRFYRDAKVVSYALRSAAENEWRDIASAPAEGEFYAPDQFGNIIKVQRFPMPAGYTSVIEARTGRVWNPKVWRPLPDPPEPGEPT